jgi:hypothetical protein
MTPLLVCIAAFAVGYALGKRDARRARAKA